MTSGAVARLREIAIDELARVIGPAVRDAIVKSRVHRTALELAEDYTADAFAADELGEARGYAHLAREQIGKCRAHLDRLETRLASLVEQGPAEHIPHPDEVYPS